MIQLQENKINKNLSGIKYKINNILLDATGYEEGIEPKKTILYTQLDAGKFPVGTLWVREEQDFKNNFELLK